MKWCAIVSITYVCVPRWALNPYYLPHKHQTRAHPRKRLSLTMSILRPLLQGTGHCEGLDGPELYCTTMRGPDAMPAKAGCQISLVITLDE